MKKCVILLMFVSSLAQASYKSIHSEKIPLSLKPLPYPSAALEPAIDQQTMEIHHGRHHKAFIDLANKSIPGEKKNVLEILRSVSQYPAAVRNSVGGHWNHSFFWTLFSADKNDQKMPPRLEKEITAQFGSVDNFKAEFEKSGMGRFGSGWAWLIRGADGKLQITATPYQDNPLMEVAEVKGIPVFGMDVWEHAYYLKYQNKRADYLKAVWAVVNWKKVDEYDRTWKSVK